MVTNTKKVGRVQAKKKKLGNTSDVVLENDQNGNRANHFCLSTKKNNKPIERRERRTARLADLKKNGEKKLRD